MAGILAYAGGAPRQSRGAGMVHVGVRTRGVDILADPAPKYLVNRVKLARRRHTCGRPSPRKGSGLGGGRGSGLMVYPGRR